MNTNNYQNKLQEAFETGYRDCINENIDTLNEAAPFLALGVGPLYQAAAGFLGLPAALTLLSGDDDTPNKAELEARGNINKETTMIANKRAIDGYESSGGVLYKDQIEILGGIDAAKELARLGLNILTLASRKEDSMNPAGTNSNEVVIPNAPPLENANQRLQATEAARNLSLQFDRLLNNDGTSIEDIAAGNFPG